jgi:4-diphosphocytidyl-2-C-methyl-D-erythritol kinase
MPDGDDAAAPWPAPAKLNLMLRVLGRRPDGYHRLQTVFQFIDRCDQIHLAVLADGRIERLGELPGVPAESDLTVRAARLLQRQTGCRLGAGIRVDKALPMGGGLGGGSSDAATTLVGLNQLWGTGLGLDDLAALGLRLGADVPVFVRGLAAWGEGVGEELTPVDLAEPWYLVLTPPGSVATAAVFGDPGLTRDSPAITMIDFSRGEIRNDCLPVVRRTYRQVAAALDWLTAWLADADGGEARLTGTGGCVFAAFATRAAAVAARDAAPAALGAFVARGLNRSPLLDRLAP